MSRQLICTGLAALLATPAALAATDTSLTIYHADNDSLFSGSAEYTVDAGHALVRDRRQVDLAAGIHELLIDGLPAAADPESTTVTFDPAARVTVLGQQMRAAHPLAEAVGKTVDIFTGTTGGGVHLHGTLLGWARDDAAMIRTDDGAVHLVRHYVSMTLPGGSALESANLRLRVDARTAGMRNAHLAYMTTGLGWRAAYTATLAQGATCSMQFSPEASIANRSGRDFDHATIKLVAGQPNFGGRARAFRSMSAPAPMATEAQPMPQQAALDDYRSFTLSGTTDLPNGTVTLLPLYAAQTLACQRQYVVEDGGSYFPPKPNTNDYGAQDYQDRAIASSLAFTAPDALPAGTLRAWTTDRDGAPALLGEGGIADTPKGQRVSVDLGQSFDLRASRERTAFHVDAKAHTLSEGYRITVSNGGDAPRTVTVREHPNRWRVWTVASSSIKPSKQTQQMLEFEVSVPAHGKTVLDYAVRYTWTAQDVQ